MSAAGTWRCHPRTSPAAGCWRQLAANAIAHSASGEGGSFTLRLRARSGWARIEVTGDGPAQDQPAPRNGWGLAIVAGAADQATAVTQPDGCRTASAEVRWPA